MGPTAFSRSSIPFLAIFMPAAQVCLAGTILYQDDFETNKAMYDSYDHSSFGGGGDIHLFGYLDYGPGVYGRGLGFFKGWEVYSDAYLGYAVVPPGMIATSGSISFLLADIVFPPQPAGGISVWGSANGSTWVPLSTVPGGFNPSLVSVPLSPATPAQFLRLRGLGVIDNLQINVTYDVPEPATFLLLALAGAGLFTKKRSPAA